MKDSEPQKSSTFNLSKSSTVREILKQGSTDELLYENNIIFNQRQGGRPRMQIQDNDKETKRKNNRQAGE